VSADATSQGSTIGIFIAVTLTLQFNLFTEMPFQVSIASTLALSLLLTNFPSV
jgi:hypothetical protein